MEKVTPATVAWCAGVIDSLGHITTRKLPTGSTIAVVTVSSPKVEILERLSELTGTKPITVRRDYSRLGCSDHCTERHLHVKSTSGRWSVSGARASILLRCLTPHLITTLQKASEVLREADAPYKEATVRKMEELGWTSGETLERGSSEDA